ncbi:MAG: hypothetical protein QF915_02720 [Candidatus Woesearchaeota archaeon]|jgi:hypothetical protein|nr:hypothetical protein [Candidatus Woesearchaeota archaeon]
MPRLRNAAIIITLTALTIGGFFYKKHKIDSTPIIKGTGTVTSLDPYHFYGSMLSSSGVMAKISGVDRLIDFNHIEGVEEGDTVNYQAREPFYLIILDEDLEGLAIKKTE